MGILAWHEAINDTLGGTPIVVTYCPLCDSAFVFERNIGDEVREFGISGLLYQSNVLLYDRQRKSDKESLWSQAAMKAVCGPAADEGLRLKLVDSSLTTFADWKGDYPDSTVVSLATGHNRPYLQQAYAMYFATDELVFPVKGGADRRPDLRNKDKVLVLTANKEMRAYAIRDLASDPDHAIEDELAGTAVRIVYDPETGGVEVEGAANSPVRRAYMFWFIYNAMYPEGDIYSAMKKGSGK